MDNIIILDETDVIRLYCYRWPTREDSCEDGDLLTFVWWDMSGIQKYMRSNWYTHYCHCDESGFSTYNQINL